MMLWVNKMLAIIPARGGSKRLKNKNIYPVLDKPMIFWTLDAALATRAIDSIVVSTDSDLIAAEIRKCCAYDDVAIIDRCAELGSDDCIVQRVVEDVVQRLKYLDEYLLVLQANSPQITSELIEHVVELGCKYGCHDVRTYDHNGIANGAVWFLRTEDLFSGSLSTYAGCLVVDLIDIHTIEDVYEAERVLKS